MPGSFHVTRKQNRARELNEIESETTLPRPAVSFPRDLVKARVTSLQKSRVFGDNWACGGVRLCPSGRGAPGGRRPPAPLRAPRRRRSALSPMSSEAEENPSALPDAELGALSILSAVPH